MNGRDLSEEKLRYLKREMMTLWSETFHDSDNYINIVFETYFNPDNVFVSYDGEVLIAALLGVPYEFKIVKEGTFDKLKGLYLCGLSTRPSYRNRGIMSHLMEEAEKEASQRGYDITFLIPADDHLRHYYKRKGYEDDSFRKREFLDCIDYTEPSFHSYSIRELISDENKNRIAEIEDWCRSKEERSTANTILHSTTDFKAILAENENSFFLTKDAVDLKYSILAKLEAVVFPQLKIAENGDKVAEIVGLFFKEREEEEKEDQKYIPCKLRNEILHSIMRIFTECSSIEIVTPCRNGNQECQGIEPYAMMKKLKHAPDLNDHMNQTFQIYLMLD